MKVLTDKVTFSTSDEEVKDLTKEVQRKVKESGVEEGICLLFAPHATGVLILNENEEGIKQDYLKALNKIVPKEKDWSHDRIDNNAHAHIKSALVGTDRTVPITDGKLDLGTWQNVFFIETDGPRRKRTVKLKLLGE